VVPHGVLHELPFAALTPDGHRFLSDDFSISYLPSVSALSYLHSKPVSSAPRALVLASDQEEGFPLLASANDEGQSVGAFFDTKLMLGKEATSAALRENGADYDILHLIAHFEIDRKNPMASRILLSRGEKGEESPLDLAGVYRLSLRKTDLVVLSGCQSQTGKRTRGDDIIGLSQAFLYAGSPSVVASLWSVDDDATKLLMVSFYSGLRRGTSKTDALRLAQIEVRRKYPSPFYWAAFVLNGDPGGHEAAPSVAAN
jgi:CHAT domain-containing protein